LIGGIDYGYEKESDRQEGSCKEGSPCEKDRQEIVSTDIQKRRQRYVQSAKEGF
jgi:hypothetical protein